MLKSQYKVMKINGADPSHGITSRTFQYNENEALSVDEQALVADNLAESGYVEENAEEGDNEDMNLVDWIFAVSDTNDEAISEIENIMSAFSDEEEANFVDGEHKDEYKDFSGPLNQQFIDSLLSYVSDNPNHNSNVDEDEGPKASNADLNYLAALGLIGPDNVRVSDGEEGKTVQAEINGVKHDVFHLGDQFGLDSDRVR